MVDDGTYQTALEALSVTNPAKDREASVKGRPASQASWVLTNPVYLEWKGQDACQVLWIHGNAGKGQAVIASSLIEELSSEAAQNETTLLAYFFCDENNPHRRNTLDMLKTLIRQMILQNRDLTEYLLVDQRKRKKGEQKHQNFDVTSVSALWANLQNMFKDVSVKTIYFVVNALSETDGESRTEFLKLLSPYLEPETDEHSTNEDIRVKWVFLSRSGRPDIEKALQKSLVINMEDDENISSVDDGVKAEISSQVDQLAKEKNYSPALAYFVKRYIHSKAEGNYIYVSLVIQELKNLEPTQSSSFVIRKFLEGLPYGLTEIFEHIRHRVSVPMGLIPHLSALAVLCTIIFGLRPLMSCLFFTSFQSTNAVLSIPLTDNKCLTFLATSPLTEAGAGIGCP